MKDKIVLVGGGELAKVLITVIESLGSYDIIGYTDIKEKEISSQIKYLGTDEVLYEMIESNPDCKAVIGIGLIKVSHVRNRIYKMLKELGYELPIIISEKAVVYKSVKIGEGTIIMANAVINPGAIIGKCGLVFSGAIIEHDCIVEDFVTFNTGSIVAAGTRIGNNSVLSIASVIVHHKNISSNCFIGAGSVVINDITKEGTYFGVPARKIIP